MKKYMSAFDGKIKIITLALLFAILATAGFQCKLLPNKKLQEAIQPVKLTYWRVWDDEDSFKEIIAGFNALHPNISIEYRRLRYEEYEDELLNALAEDRGPDIISIHNTWVGKYQNKITPMPAAVTLPIQYEKGTIKKEKVTELQTTPAISLRELKNNFVDVVYDDVVRTIPSDEKGAPDQKQIIGIPLSVDSLVMFYNEKLLNNAGIPLPPKDWTEFQQAVKKMTRQDSKGEIILAGAALGTAQNIDRASDVLTLLMMQNGAQMADDQGRATFNKMPRDLKLPVLPAVGALNFYADFANPAKETYTWNKKMPNALEMFTQGRLGFFFGYSYHLPIIKAQAPKLKFSIAAMPQTSEIPINYANYWVETVTKKSKHPNEAWGFLLYASQEKNVIKHLEQAKKPTALRALISKQINNLELSAFASQVLTAKSWYKGSNANAVEEIFNEMIDAVSEGRIEPEKAISNANNKVNQTITIR